MLRGRKHVVLKLPSRNEAGILSRTAWLDAPCFAVESRCPSSRSNVPYLSHQAEGLCRLFCLSTSWCIRIYLACLGRTMCDATVVTESDNRHRSGAHHTREFGKAGHSIQLQAPYASST